MIRAIEKVQMIVIINRTPNRPVIYAFGKYHVQIVARVNAQAEVYVSCPIFDSLVKG